MSVPKRAWGWLGTAASVRAITAGMIIYALIIGFLVLGYARVSGCLADYADKSARATAERARIATEDRALDESDRQAQRRAEDALDDMLATIVRAQDSRERRAAFAELVRVRSDVAKIRDENAETRRRNEQERRRNPVPLPPSETC